MRPEIQSVNLDMTTHCDRRCPECCCGIGINRVLQHHPWSYFERAAKALYGIPRVHLCGGEPTVHPNFAAFVPRFKDLFGCQRLTMVTDGWGVGRYRDVIATYIDEVTFSDYVSNRPAKQILIKIGAPLVYAPGGPEATDFVPRSRIGGGHPCTRAWWIGKGVAYADGQIFGCSVAPGIDGAQGIEPEPGWDERIAELPCKVCFMSETA